MACPKVFPEASAGGAPRSMIIEPTEGIPDAFVVVEGSSERRPVTDGEAFEKPALAAARLAFERCRSETIYQ